MTDRPPQRTLLAVEEGAAIAATMSPIAALDTLPLGEDLIINGDGDDERLLDPPSATSFAALTLAAPRSSAR